MYFAFIMTPTEFKRLIKKHYGKTLNKHELDLYQWTMTANPDDELELAFSELAKHDLGRKRPLVPSPKAVYEKIREIKETTQRS